MIKRNVIKIGNVYSKRDWGYAPEYVEAMWKMLQLKKKNDFVIGTGKTYTIKYFINETCRYLKIPIKWKGIGLNEYCLNKKNNKKIIVIDKKYYRPLDVYSLKSKPSRAKKILKWSYRTNLKGLIKQMCDSELKELNVKIK